MKVLLAMDESIYSEASVRFLCALGLGPGTEVTVFTVVPEHVFLGGHTLGDLLGRSTKLKSQLATAQEERAMDLVSRAKATLSRAGMSGAYHGPQRKAC